MIYRRISKICYKLIKRLSDTDTFDKVTRWVERCRSIRRLDFNPKQRIKYDIKSLRRLQHRGRFIKPKSSRGLKEEFPQLYSKLQKEGITL